MKKFTIIIGLSIIIPIILLIGVYVWTDPFKTLKPFSLHYFDDTNRDYLSSELYLRNNPIYHYDSFIFGSSRAGGLNSYQWKQQLPDSAKQFVFQGWSETITGIKLKLEYIDEHGEKINNALILLDVPGSFSEPQEPTKVLSIKHYKFSKQPFFLYQLHLFSGFIKPSFIYKSIIDRNVDRYEWIGFDTISNDWESTNRYRFSECPPKDSLKKCTKRTLDVFFKQISQIDSQKISKPIISKDKETILNKIKLILDKNNTTYKIVISPGYYLTNPAINPMDLNILYNIFGESNVYNYSGDNNLTHDYNNFSDPNHFGLHVGWHIIEALKK